MPTLPDSTTESTQESSDYGLSTDALRALVRKHGLERQVGKPAEKMSRYQLLNMLVTKASTDALQLISGGNGNGSGVDEATVRRLIAEHVGQAATPTTTIVIKQPTGEKLRICGTMHKALPDVLRLVSAGIPVLLVGPAGSGKTFLAGQIAKALDLPFSFNSMSAGVTESSLLGRVLPDAAGNWTYRPAPFVTTYEKGGVHLFDEVDAADPNLMVVINAAIANGNLAIPFADMPPIKRHDETVLIAAANTYGNGADRQYVGRNQLDAATVDRFAMGTIEVDYDGELERKIADGILGNKAEAESLLAWAWSTRNRIADTRLRRLLSTRTIENAAKRMASGAKLEDVKRTYFLGWTEDEQRKAGA